MSKRFLCIALLLHFGMLLLPQVLPSRLRSTRVVRKSIPVKVRIDPQPRPVDEAVMKPEIAASVPPSRKPLAAAKDHAPSAAQQKPAVDSYADFLPGAAWRASEGEAGQRNEYGGGSMPPALKAEADRFSGKLDVPFVAREKLQPSKAIAKIVRTTDGGYLFEYVDGEPILRAVLFEAMRSRNGLEQVEALLRQLETDELLIVLRQAVVQGPHITGETVEHYMIEGNKLTIAKTLVLGNAHSGISLPDAEAERGRRRDASHLEKLKQSPAYQGPVRRRRP